MQTQKSKLPKWLGFLQQLPRVHLLYLQQSQLQDEHPQGAFPYLTNNLQGCLRVSFHLFWQLRLSGRQTWKNETSCSCVHSQWDVVRCLVCPSLYSAFSCPSPPPLLWRVFLWLLQCCKCMHMACNRHCRVVIMAVCSKPASLDANPLFWITEQ